MILEIVGVLFGLFFLIVGYIWSFGLLSFFPSLFIFLFSLILLFKDFRWNAYALCVNFYNGTPALKLNDARKFSKKGKAWLQISGFKKVFPYPDKDFVGLNLTNRRPFFCVFYQEGEELSPVQSLYELEGIKFISSSLIANHYQMSGIVRNVVKPPVDTLQAIVNVGLLICMLGCIITNVYIAGKLGMNMGALDGVVVKIDDLLDKFDAFMNKVGGSVGNFGGMIDDSLNDVPPITNPLNSV